MYFLRATRPSTISLNLRMEQRFAARDGDQGSAPHLIDGLEALLGSQLFFENVSGILNLPATGTGEIAAEEGLEHEDQWILLAPGKFLPSDVARDSPHL